MWVQRAHFKPGAAVITEGTVTANGISVNRYGRNGNIGLAYRALCIAAGRSLGVRPSKHASQL